MHGLSVTGALTALILGMTCAPALHAQEFPRRPIRLIVPFAPGGTSDIVGRLVAATLSDDLRQQVITDNRAGAGAVIGTEIAARAMADGYTIIVNHIGLAINETMYPKRNYNALADLTGITLLGFTPNALVLNNALPAKNARDFIALAKAQPGKIAYGSGGVGSASHLSAALLEQLAGVRFNHIPYKGAGPAMIDVIAGHVQFSAPTLPVALTHYNAGHVQLVATTGEKRAPTLPAIPTLAEAGVPGYSYTTWYALFAPANTPKPIVARINQAFVQALHNTDLGQLLALQGLEPASSTPEQLNNRLRVDIDKWRKVIKSAGIDPQ